MSAETPGEPAPDDATRQFITFTIGAEEYGVDIMAVREIKGWMATTRLPNAPRHVRGVINLRGTIVPIFDLRARFGQGLTEATKTHVVVIVSIGARVVGLLVDAVSDILAISASGILPVPEMERTVDVDYLSGLVTVDGRMVALLDLDRLLDINQLVAAQEAAQSVKSGAQG